MKQPISLALWLTILTIFLTAEKQILAAEGGPGFLTCSEMASGGHGDEQEFAKFVTATLRANSRFGQAEELIHAQLLTSYISGEFSLENVMKYWDEKSFEMALKRVMNAMHAKYNIKAKSEDVADTSKGEKRISLEKIKENSYKYFTFTSLASLKLFMWLGAEIPLEINEIGEAAFAENRNFTQEELLLIAKYLDIHRKTILSKNIKMSEFNLLVSSLLSSTAVKKRMDAYKDVLTQSGTSSVEEAYTTTADVLEDIAKQIQNRKPEWERSDILQMLSFYTSHPVE